MIGVILWSDETERKAVVWCEDQGDLAFVDKSVSPAGTEPFFAVGDIVRFDLCVEANLRKAHNARLLEDQTAACSAPAERQRGTQETAKIIPFRVLPKVHDSEEKRNAQGA